MILYGHIAKTVYCNTSEDVLNGNAIVKTLKAWELSPADMAAACFSSPDKTENGTAHVANSVLRLVV